jgi:PAS domain S-box-containing protein
MAQNRKELPLDNLAALRRRVAELEASEIQRRQEEEALRKREGYFQALIENSLDGIVVMDGELDIIYESPSAARIFGYESGELSAKEALVLIHPDDITKVALTFRQLVENPGESVRQEVRVKQKDGTWRTVEGVAISLLHKPAVNGILITFRDINERSRTEEAQYENALALAMINEFHLTETEKKVLLLMAEGQSNRQIAERLVVSRSTVRFHVSDILHKLGVSSRTEAVAVAMRHHLVT